MEGKLIIIDSKNTYVNGNHKTRLVYVLLNRQVNLSSESWHYNNTPYTILCVTFIFI